MFLQLLISRVSPAVLSRPAILPLQ